MAYNSTQNQKSLKTVCGIGLCGLKTDLKGPAPSHPSENVDIIDETINFYRVNMLMKNFPVKGIQEQLRRRAC